MVIRTVDLGADKYTQSRARIPERNPFLGCRSIRFCMQHIPMFKTQIRAILRAAVDADVSLLFPLVTSLQELRQARGLPLPDYRLLNEEGPPHRRRFEVGVFLDGALEARGCGSSKKEAEQTAARKVLAKLYDGSLEG